MTINMQQLDKIERLHSEQHPRNRSWRRRLARAEAAAWPGFHVTAGEIRKDAKFIKKNAYKVNLLIKVNL